MSRASRLGLGLTSPGAAWLSVGALTVAYALTMARGLTFYDSPELALVAHQLGVGHPVGQPTHTLIGFVFAHLPMVSVHVGLTAMSAAFGALCAIPAWSLSERLVPETGGRADRIARGVVIVGCGLSLIAWEPATRVEVYTLATFLALWATARVAHRGASLSAGIALGLSAGAHAVIAVAQGLGTLAIAWPSRSGADPEPPPAEPRWRSLARMTLGGLLGLTVYAVVPIAASAHPVRFAWGAPRDGESLLAYLRGADYAHNQGITLLDWLDHAWRLLWWGAQNGALVVAALGAAALLVLATRRPTKDRRGRALRWTLLLVALIDVGFVAANVVFHPDVPDYRGYFLAPFWMAASGIAALSARLLREGGRMRIYGGVCAALPAVALLASPGHLAGPRDQPSLAETIARGALVESPPDAILVVEADHWVAPLLYLQEVEATRRDVTILPVGLASSRWYWEHVFSLHPDLASIPLAGPGGRAGRIRRLLAANSARPVLVESVRVAASVGVRPCGVGYLLHTTCPSPVDPSIATAAITRAAPLRGESLEVAGRVGEARGEALWRMGECSSSASAWLAGVSGSGVGRPLPQDLPARAPPLTGPLPDWSRPAALHDPARNLALSALLLDACGERAAALRMVDAAIELGLDEANLARAQILTGR